MCNGTMYYLYGIFLQKNTLKHNILILIFMLYCWKVFELTGTGGLTDIFIDLIQVGNFL